MMSARRGGRKTALITGISGQDGWYLSRLLLSHGYHVTGTSHRLREARVDRTSVAPVEVVPLDMTDGSAIAELVERGQYDEVYNLAAVASSDQRFARPGESSIVNAIAVCWFLEAIHSSSRHTRFCQASSSDIFAGSSVSPQDENTEPRPVSPYGAAKLYADTLVRIYREQFGLFACSAVLFSHESPRRSHAHVVRKVTHGVAMIAAGKTDQLVLGNLSAIRDWGHAEDFVDAMHRILGAPDPDDYVVATGRPHTVEDVCRYAFGAVGLRLEDYVTMDRHLHSMELTPRVGDSSRARLVLGWRPRWSLKSIVLEMLAYDRSLLSLPEEH